MRSIFVPLPCLNLSLHTCSLPRSRPILAYHHDTSKESGFYPSGAILAQVQHVNLLGRNVYYDPRLVSYSPVVVGSPLILHARISPSNRRCTTQPMQYFQQIDRIFLLLCLDYRIMYLGCSQLLCKSARFRRFQPRQQTSRSECLLLHSRTITCNGPGKIGGSSES